MPISPEILDRIAPGARLLIRDAEWLVRRVDATGTGGKAIAALGLSELVRDRERIFLTEIEPRIDILDPVATRLAADDSPHFLRSRLFLESLLRRTPPTDDHLHIGHRAAMDVVPYQLDPAFQALRQPRQRILVADAVGLGKTLEAGILLSELIRRGRGKRILVVALKSLLTQFQKEMWSRFSIPLVRLDSVGIQRIRSRIPAHHNPFHHFDRAIISMDTLKQDAEYRAYIESADWDVIVIDEAHNVAERRGGASLRARLARLLARRSDALILLSATPHDGRARSFASLMNMLDPTAIADPDDYGPEDISGLFIRRFKKDVQDQVNLAFRDREIGQVHCDATPAEEIAFDRLTLLDFSGFDRRRGGGRLFRITLEKALFSSPAACISTIDNRVRRLEAADPEGRSGDVAALNELRTAVAAVEPADFSRYRALLKAIRDPGTGFGWTGKNPADRLVVFTERIETLRWLQQRLREDLNLPETAVAILHGGMSDVDQQAAVEAFGQESEPVRLLVASDVAAEGINLHYLCHRMIHFDIPWSLMVFQQRNGRIDRYGQKETPRILYLLTRSRNPRIAGDLRILELLVKKDEEAIRNIGDPAELMGVHDAEMETDITAAAMEAEKTPEQFEADSLSLPLGFDPLAILRAAGAAEPAGPSESAPERRDMPGLFPDDYHFLKSALGLLGREMTIQADFDDDARRIDLHPPEDLAARFDQFPREILPESGQPFVLTADTDRIQEEIAFCRKTESAWPRIHYLWPLNPVVEWACDKLAAAFRRHEAPVLTLGGALAADESIFLLSGLIPNRKGQPLIHHWMGVWFRGGIFHGIMTFPELLARTRLDREVFPNPGGEIDAAPLEALLPEAVDRARKWIGERRTEFEAEINPRLNEQLARLEALRKRKTRHIRKTLDGDADRRDRELREIDRLFDDYLDWVQETMTTENRPWIQVAAVLRGRP